MDIQNKIQMFSLCQLRHILAQVAGHFQQVEAQRFELQFVGFDFGKIEDIVDQAEQGIGTAGGQINAVFLFAVERCGT